MASLALAQLLNDKNLCLREVAAKALRDIAPLPPSVLPLLKNALVDCNHQVRIHIAVALALSGNICESLVNDLCVALNDQIESVRWYAAVTLGQLGAKALRAAPKLRDVIRDDVESVRIVATAALNKISPQGYFNTLMTMTLEEMQQSGLRKVPTAQLV